MPLPSGRNCGARTLAGYDAIDGQRVDENAHRDIGFLNRRYIRPYTRRNFDINRSRQCAASLEHARTCKFLMDFSLGSFALTARAVALAASREG